MNQYMSQRILFLEKENERLTSQLKREREDDVVVDSYSTPKKQRLPTASVCPDAPIKPPPVKALSAPQMGDIYHR